MKKYVLTAAIALLSSPAWAADPIDVPEMDAGVGFAAIALLVGAAAIIRERSKRK
ncbi:MAG: hypothetical protein HKN14_00530 [Marinicaulis sp.]|nr:hypothetical protein [Marinicaulis sp.]NNL89415.1 hypothetical protein [Marinicaulis sp.]